jgi:peptide/nickel transport system permease protein
VSSLPAFSEAERPAEHEVEGPGAERRRLTRGQLAPFKNVYWALLGLFILVAAFAPWIAPYDPVRADLASQLLTPSSSHLFGTDANGMDIFSRVLWATRSDFSIAFMGVLVGVLVGVPLGAVSGFFSGIVDEVLSRLSDVIQSIPFLLFALMIIAALGNSRVVLAGIIAFVNVPIFFKLTRSVVLPMVASDFIAASRCAGLRSSALIARHVVPNALGPTASQLSISCAYAIQIVAGISFIGLGVPIPEPEWGSMIQLGAGRIIYGQWWPAFFPGLAVMLAVIAFGGIGRQLSKWYGR